MIAGNAPAAAIGTPGPSGTGWVAQGGHSGAYNNGSNGAIAQPAGGGGGNGGSSLNSLDGLQDSDAMKRGIKKLQSVILAN